MNSRTPGRVLFGGLLMATLLGARSSSAFCQATTCDATKTDCKPDAAGCFTVGFPLSWASNCVTVSVQADGSASQQIDYDVAEASVTRAFSAWTGAACSGGKPSISVKIQGPITCDASEYNQDRGNANIVVFRDSWPYVGGEDALGLTRLRFKPETGEIYDSDIEVNTVTEPLSVGDPQANAVDLDSLLTHEAGHLLGLAHSMVTGATMNPGYKLGSIELRSLAADDIAGLCEIYSPKRQVSSTSCEPRHGFADLCGADQSLPAPETAVKSAPTRSSCSFSLPGTNSVGVFALSVLFAFGWRRKRRLVAASLTSAALAGCTLDTRQLQVAASSAAGQPSAGSSMNSASTPGAINEQGGASGQVVDGPAMVDGCTDLDEDGIADCDETLIQNATFKTDVDSWHADGDAELKWDERNAADDLPSGSALLTGDAGSAAPDFASQSASQCSKVTGKRLVTVYANAFVDSAQSAQARVDVQFFDTEACAGSYVTSFSTPQPLDAASGKWLALKAGSVSGENTKSVLVRLIVSRPLDEASVEASFDNVLLKATEIQ